MFFDMHEEENQFVGLRTSKVQKPAGHTTH